MIYTTKYTQRFPVNVGGDADDTVADTVDYRRHPQYDLFMVRDHPFIHGKGADKVPMIASLVWRKERESLLLLNQRAIPRAFGTVECKTHSEVSRAIQSMTIRGAPAIGAAAAYGMAMAAINYHRDNAHKLPPPSPAQFARFMRS